MIETKQSMASKSLSIKVEKGKALNIDNSTSVDDLWNSIVSCINNTYPASSIKYDATNNTIEVSLSPVVSFKFSKDDNKGILYSIRMPYYINDDEYSLFRGIKEEVIYPLVKINDTWKYLIFRGKVDLAYDDRITDDYWPTIVLSAIVLNNSYFRVDLSGLTLDFVSTVVGEKFTKDYLISYGLQYGISLTPSSFPDNFAYVKVDSVTLSATRPVRLDMKNDSFNIELSSSVSFYKNGLVIEPNIGIFVPEYRVLLDSERRTKPIAIKIDYSVYDSNDNLITNGSIYYQTIYDLAFRVRYSENSSLYRYFGLIVQPKQEIIKVQQKVSSTEPVYRLEKTPSLLEGGRYVIVLNSSSYAYRIVKSVNGTDIELDSDLPFEVTDDTYLFFTVPNNSIIDFEKVKEISSSINGSAFDILSASLSTFKSSESNSVFVRNNVILLFSPKVADLDRSCLGSFGMENTLSFYDYVGFLDDMPSKLTRNIYVSLPKYPIADNSIEATDFLKSLDYLDFHTFAEFSDDSLESRTFIPYTIIQKPSDSKNLDFVGFVPNILVADEAIMELFPLKGFVNYNELKQVDSVGVVIDRIYNDNSKQCVIYNAGFPLNLEGKYFEVR